MGVGAARSKAALRRVPASTSTPATATPTTTLTATPTAGIVTPVPLGSWVAWPERPTDALPLEDVELRDVYFPSPDEGWAVGFGKRRLPGWDDVAIVLHYRDDEWVVDESLPLKDMRLYAIDGTDADNIWAVGKDYQPLIFRDGDVAAIVHYDGERWTKYNIESLGRAARAVLKDIDMLVGDNGIEGWATSEQSPDGRGGYVIHLVNGTWETQREINGQDLLTIDMVNATDGWIVGHKEDSTGWYHWYHNGAWGHGSSWGGFMFGVSMADSTYGLAIGRHDSATEYYGECHTDSIPGCGWKQHPGIRAGEEQDPLRVDFQDVQLLSRYDGWLVGTHHGVASTVIHYERLSREVSQRTRSLINWQLMDIEGDPVEDLYGIYMLPGSDGWAVDGWAVGEAGAILHYQGPTVPVTETPTSMATTTSTVTVTVSPTATSTATPSAAPAPSPTPTASPTPELAHRYFYLPFLTRNSQSGSS
ncbi:MAG: hypothetical protein ACE5LU_06070 [Anaerolineae bacterium]